MNRKNIWIIGRPEGWVLQREGTFKTFATHRSSSAAWEAALKLALKDGDNVIYQNIDGKVGQVWSYATNQISVNGVVFDPTSPLWSDKLGQISKEKRPMTAALILDQEKALVLAARKKLRGILPDHRLLDDNAPMGSIKAPENFNGENFADFLDLTNLKPQATSTDIVALCDKAEEMGAATVCVNASRVSLAAELLDGTSTKAICVVGFPLGNTLPEAIAAEAKLAVEEGAEELDMVINVGLLLDGEYGRVYEQVRTVVQAVDVPVKVILETCKLSDEQVVLASLIAACAGAAFVKTSTGFSMDKRDDQPHTGATVGRIRLMRLAVGDNLGVKASGGIKTAGDATSLLQNGADRLGASGLNTGDSY